MACKVFVYILGVGVYNISSPTGLGVYKKFRPLQGWGIQKCCPLQGCGVYKNFVPYFCPCNGGGGYLQIFCPFTWGRHTTSLSMYLGPAKFRPCTVGTQHFLSRTCPRTVGPRDYVPQISLFMYRIYNQGLERGNKPPLWLARCAGTRKVAGSNPAGCKFFLVKIFVPQKWPPGKVSPKCG